MHQSDVFELIQYAPSGDDLRATLVVIPPQINKVYISDIVPGRSLIEHWSAPGCRTSRSAGATRRGAQRDWNLDSSRPCKAAIQVVSDHR